MSTYTFCRMVPSRCTCTFWNRVAVSFSRTVKTASVVVVMQIKVYREADDSEDDNEELELAQANASSLGPGSACLYNDSQIHQAHARYSILFQTVYQAL